MLVRFLPLETINGSTNLFQLPQAYQGGDVTVFVNGALYAAENDNEHPYGYTVETANKTVSFYTPLSNGDSLFLMYDDGKDDIDYSNVDWKKNIQITTFDVKPKTITWEYKATRINWSVKSSRMDWTVKKQRELFDTTKRRIIFKTK